MSLMPLARVFSMRRLIRPTVRLDLRADRRHLRVADLEATRVAVGVDLGAYGQAGTGGGGVDQLDHDLVAGQWPAPPVAADRGEQAVLDPVPLGRARREMTDRDRQPDFGGQPGELEFPRQTR